ncbi:MAG: NAD(P)/FAD-dependent oxidoreductase [Thermoguttaceae bacterium]|jgi:NADPH-dependent 2,4-dienoyl-CoA reductase/sulfur reductase-like enzyme
MGASHEFKQVVDADFDAQPWDIAIVGGGPAGLAAAVSAYDAGAKRVLILERDRELGGVLNQCVHNGFGLRRFREELTGPEYAGRYIDLAKEREIPVALEATVLDIAEDPHSDSLSPIVVNFLSPTLGFRRIHVRAVVLATGCRERARGAIRTPGDRPSGVFTAGAAQRFMNCEGKRVGNRVVILGSGDIGLIMARRLTLEGAKTLAVVELMPHSNGLARNVVQCLEDFDIPLYLSHTISRIVGDRRLEKVVVAPVDENYQPIAASEFEIECDTLLLSVGLIPENEVARTAGVELDSRTRGPIVTQTRETSIPGVFACGNSLHVHDLVDFVSEEAEEAGRNAAARALGQTRRSERFARVVNGDGVMYVVPQKLDLDALPDEVPFFLRVRDVLKNKRLVVRKGDETIKEIRRLRVAPSEMERVVLKKDQLANLDGQTISISLED